MLPRRLSLLAAAGIALLTTACAPGTWTGGGWIPSADHVAGHKANFGFVLHAEDTDANGEVDTARGQIQYQDPSMDVRFHADVESGGVLPAFVYLFGANGYIGSGQVSGMEGTYEPQPATAGDGGTVRVGILPIEEGPATGQTYVYFEFLTGVYAGYVNSGPAQGNVTFHED